MMRHAVITAGLVLALFSGRARAQDANPNNAERVAAAKSLFDQGQSLMDQKNFGDACAKFRASNEQVAKVGTLLNLADCYEKNGQNASAWATYNDAIGLGRRQGRPEFEEFAKKKTADLEPTLSKMTLIVPREVIIEGLVVTRDGNKLSEGAWGVPIPVDPGKHTIQATAPKKLPWKGTIDINADRKVHELTVGPLEDAPVDAPVIQHEIVTRVIEQRSFWTPLHIAGAIVGGVGVGALAGGGVFGGVAISTWKSAKDLCGPSIPVCAFNSDGPSKADQAKTFATVSTALFIGGGIAVAGGVTMLLIGKSKSTEQQATTAAHVWPLVGPGSLGVGGDF